MRMRSVIDFAMVIQPSAVERGVVDGDWLLFAGASLIRDMGMKPVPHTARLAPDAVIDDKLLFIAQHVRDRSLSECLSDTEFILFAAKRFGSLRLEQLRAIIAVCWLYKQTNTTLSDAMRDVVRTCVEEAEKVEFSCPRTMLAEKWQGWAERALSGEPECRCDDCLEDNKTVVLERARKIAAKNAAQSEVAE